MIDIITHKGKALEELTREELEEAFRILWTEMAILQSHYDSLRRTVLGPAAA